MWLHIHGQGSKGSDHWSLSVFCAVYREDATTSPVLDVHLIIGEVVSLLKQSIDKQVKIKEQLPAASFTTMSNPTQLKSALLDVPLNACDSMPEWSDLTLVPTLRPFDGSRGDAGATGSFAHK